MNDTKYQLRYLPLFYSDMAQAVNYISDVLKNPIAAANLIDKTEKAILGRLENPKITQPFHSVKDRKHPYYRIIVNNFSAFYVVIDDIMEVRRFLYNKRDIRSII